MKLIITDLADFGIPVAGDYKLIKPEGEIHGCIGCFNCWLKTPGRCVIHDGYENTGIYMSRCSEYIIVSRCVYGSASPFVKAVQDRALSYIHPDFVIRGGEMHHKRRYDNVLEISAYFYAGDRPLSDAEKQTARKLMQANADNFDGRVKTVEFYDSAKALEGLTL